MRAPERPVAPPGWPAPVRPPGAPDWEGTASAWLLDQCPPEYRTYPALRRGLSEARGDLRDVADAMAVDAAVEAWHRESARLIGVRRAAGLVEEALRGRRFRARL